LNSRIGLHSSGKAVDQGRQTGGGDDAAENQAGRSIAKPLVIHYHSISESYWKFRLTMLWVWKKAHEGRRH
jgi:hypothetical protein